MVAVVVGLDATPCILHPGIVEFLFKNRRTVGRIFRDMIGLCEVDYVGITLIDEDKQIVFLSSQPSMEYNLIEHDLWQYDGSNHPSFYSGSELRSWDSLYASDKHELLLKYKHSRTGFRCGIAIPFEFENSHAVFSFASKSVSPEKFHLLSQRRAALERIALYCLRQLKAKVELPFFIDEIDEDTGRNHLTLIVNH